MKFSLQMINKSKKILPVLLGLQLFIAVIFFGCVDLPSDISLPQWDVDLNIPLLKKSYILDDIIDSENEPNISIDPVDSLYIIQSDNYLSASDVSPFMQVVNESSSKNNLLPVVNDDSLQLFIPFPDSIEIEKADFKSGAIFFELSNHSAVNDIEVNVQIPGIKKPDDALLELQFNVHPNTTIQSTYYLDGHSYSEPLNQNSLFKGKIWLIAKAKSNDAAAFASFDVVTKDMKFASAKGYIPTKIIKAEREAFEINLGSELQNYKDKISLKDAKLNLKAQYKAADLDPFEIEIKNLKIIGKRKSGEEKELIFNESLLSPAASNYRLNNGALQKIFSDDNSNITDFISFLPDSIIINADYVLNPDNNKTYKNVNVNDSVIVETNFNTKSFLALKKTTITDTLDVEITESDRDKILNAISADITIDAENRIPLTAFFKITFADENYNALFTLKENNSDDSIMIAGANIDKSTGEVIAANATTQLIEINGEEIQKFSKARFAFLSISVRTKDALDNNLTPPFVAVHSSDWINIKSFGKIKYRLNSDDD